MDEKMSSDFWQNHSLRYLEMAFRTDRQEIINNPDGYGKKTGDCGDTVEIFLVARDNLIEKASYYLNGCMNTAACANTIVQMTENKTIDQAWEITPEAVAGYLETLPKDHFHCAELTVGALYMALSNLLELRRAQWKKVYQAR
ncbi:MAG: nitrogen fixation protein NifU [Thermodesulfobacteriota bacterium]|jgi:nitrogen fixation NifU-like protein|nr:nitrogen fixation protein NifU [Thermodesulfobacteriota bacterium]